MHSHLYIVGLFVPLGLAFSHEPGTLVHLSKSHHILALDDACPCSDGRGMHTKTCPCESMPPLIPPPSNGHKMKFLRQKNGDDNNLKYFSSPSNSNDTDVLSESDFQNYYGYTTKGGDVSPLDIDSGYVYDGNVTGGAGNGTIAVTGNSGSAPVVPLEVVMTDQRLLSLYKGHDSSNRESNSEYEDVIGDFHSGWSVWPSSKVQYQFDPDVATCVKSVFAMAAGVISDNTCVVFEELKSSLAVEYVADTPLLRITANAGAGCYSALGYSLVAGNNVLNIGDGCVNPGTVIHLLLHALGLFHEHQRPDRDNYVQVNSGFVDTFRTGGSTSSTKFNAVFGKVDYTFNTTVAWVNATLARPYDYSSIMHNGPCHYSTSEQYGGGPSACAMNPTLVASVNSDSPSISFSGDTSMIGNRATMSFGDAQVVGNLYSCPSSSIKQPDPLDATSNDIALCTAMDAMNFEWTDTANVANIAKTPAITTATSVTSETTTTSPVEASAFQDFFKSSSRTRLLFLYATAAGAVFIIAGVLITAHFNKKRASRTGRRTMAMAVNDPADPLHRALNDGEFGDSTDSEAIGDIIDEQDEDDSPASSARTTTPFTATARVDNSSRRG